MTATADVRATVDVGDAALVLATGRVVVSVPELGGESLLIIRTRRGVFATENRCTPVGS